MKEFFSFSTPESASLKLLLENLSTNPYKDYSAFHVEVTHLINASLVPESFLHACGRIRDARSTGGELAYLIRNCPIDATRPVFNQNNPVDDKYHQKRTYVGEGFLELFAQLTGTPLLAYETRNNGDFFHDVYAHNRYSGTQTQKTDGELYFHNDRTAHPVRADYLSLLGMRCSPDNLIYTLYIDGRDLLEHLAPKWQEQLRLPLYITPYDEYSKDSNTLQVSSKPHVVLEEEHCFRYYETRTKPAPWAPQEARDAIIALKDAIIKAKKSRVLINEADLFSFPNQAGLHSREIVEVKNADQAKLRWLLKTYSFRNKEYMRCFRGAYSTDVDGFVCDSKTSPFAA